MSKARWLTPDDTGGGNVARCLSVPLSLVPYVNGALGELLFASNWEAAGSVSIADTVAAFAAILDDFYAGECMTQLYPEQYIKLWDEGTPTIGNALALNIGSSQVLNGGWNQSPAQQNDEMSFEILLAEGTYSFEITGNTNNTRGIMHFSVDGTEITTFDWYSGGGVANVKKTTTFSIVLGGSHTLSFKCSTKNASSSGYSAFVTYFKIVRTG